MFPGHTFAEQCRRVFAEIDSAFSRLAANAAWSAAFGFGFADSLLRVALVPARAAD